MIEQGMWIQIQSYKHDGSLHRLWDQGLVLEVQDDLIIVASKKTRVTEFDGRKWYTREPAITFFSTQNWFNVIAMMKEDGISFYCNIASPTIEDDRVLKYIDYDLDLKLYPNGTIKILDEHEYERHREKFHYSDRLDHVLKKEVETIYSMMKKEVFPFQKEKIASYYQQFLRFYHEQHVFDASKKGE